eukprot:scaffold37023_cov60-Phaeocystis_antarctica.AAC.1
MPMTGQPSSTSPMPPKKHAVPGGRERGVGESAGEGGGGASVCVERCCCASREVARRVSGRSGGARSHL